MARKKKLKPRKYVSIKRNAVKKALPKKDVKKDDEYNKCLRCDRQFPSRDALKKHQRMHMQALREITLLEEGHVPIESKIGFEFKGKNKIIIS